MKTKEISALLKTASFAVNAVRFMNVMKKAVVIFAVALCGMFALKIRRG